MRTFPTKKGSYTFSIIVNTCRDPYSMPLFPNKSIFDLLIENLVNQTFEDFELIVVDLCWDKRRDLFQTNYQDLPFPVLHIPDKTSIFKDLGITRICTAKNTGIIFARGRNLIFSDDCQYWGPNALKFLTGWAKNNHGATCRLYRDVGDGPYECDSRWRSLGISGTDRTWFGNANQVGYLGGTLTMLPLATMLQINGYDEMFDGSRQLEDADLCRRVGAVGLKIALEGHPRVIEYEHTACSKMANVKNIATKCNGAYGFPYWNAQKPRIRANTHIMGDNVLRSFLNDECSMLSPEGKCKASGDTCRDRYTNKKYMKIYQDMRLVFNLSVLNAQSSWDCAYNMLGVSVL